MNRPLKLSICFLLLSSGVPARDSADFICLSKQGFYPNAPKILVVNGPVNNNIFYIIRKNSPDTVPGMLARGPNPVEQDHCHYALHEPETAFADSDCIYGSNDITIYL